MDNITQMTRKRAFTLLEIMIVIFLIGLIGSVIGFNMKGSLEEGKAFKTKQAIQQVEDILTLQLAEGDITAEQIEADFVACLKRSNIIKSAETLSKDGWNNKLQVVVNKRGNVRVTSEKYAAFLRKQNKAMDVTDETEDDE